MAKRLTDKQKEEIIKSFVSGKTIDYLSDFFKCTNLTIIRNLKKNFGDQKYQEILDKNKGFTKSQKLKKDKSNITSEKNLKDETIANHTYSKDSLLESSNYDTPANSTFFEIPPLECEIDDTPQKDLASVPLSKVDLPSIVYMIVDKKVELEVKFLKDYPDWQFLSQDELKRKTIEIYFDLKTAKKICNKEQKVIKIPNSKVFKIVAPLLNSRGITRIVSEDQLIAI